MAKRPPPLDEEIVDYERNQANLDPDATRAAELAQQQEEMEDLDDDDNDEIFRITREIMGNDAARLNITRVLPADKHGYAGEMSPHEFTLERMKKMYGPGTYRVRVMGPKGFIPGGGKVIIAPDSEASPGAMSFEAMLEKLDARNKEQRDAKQDRLVQMTTILATPTATLLAALLSRKSESTDIAALVAALRPPDPMQQIAALKALMPPPAQSEDSVDKVIKMIGVLGDKLGPGVAAEGGGWLDTARRMLEAAGPSLGSIAEKIIDRLPPPGMPAAPVQMVPRPALPQPFGLAPPGASVSFPAVSPAPSVQPGASTVPIAGSRGEPIAIEGMGEEMNLQLMRLLPWFKDQVPGLLRRAARQIDPGLAAEMLIAEFPDDVNPDSLVSFIERPDWFALFAQFEPGVKQFEPWFAALRQQLLEQLAEMKAEAAQPEHFEDDTPL